MENDHRKRCLDAQAKLEEQLKPLLAAKRIDVRTVKTDCKRALNQRLNLESSVDFERSVSPSAKDEDSSMWSNDVAILTPAVRPVTWMCLLNAQGKDESIVTSADLASRHPSRDLIDLDCERTRPDCEALNAPGMRLRMANILELYCRAKDKEYKQGQCHLLAPLLIMLHDRSDGVVYNCFYSLVSRFLPSIFDNQEFESLRCVFSLFRLLFLYHDPHLCHAIEEAGVLPDVYATPWFITLFASKLPLESVHLLWDIYFIEDDPFLHLFFTLALLIANRDVIIAEARSEGGGNLGRLLTTLPITRRSATLMSQARTLRSRTPSSFRSLLFDICFKTRPMDQMEAITRASLSLPCLTIPAHEIMTQCYHSLLEDGALKFFIFDTRTKEQFDAGHLPTAVHLDPDVLTNPAELSALFGIKRMGALRGHHLCFIDDGEVPASIVHAQQLPFCAKPASSTEASPPAEQASVPDTSGVDTVIAGDELIGSARIEVPRGGAASTADTFAAFAAEEDESASPLSMFVRHFLAMGFTQVSVCEGGFLTCHRMALESQLELVDHQPAVCDQCPESKQSVVQLVAPRLAKAANWVLHTLGHSSDDKDTVSVSSTATAGESDTTPISTSDKHSAAIEETEGEHEALATANPVKASDASVKNPSASKFSLSSLSKMAKQKISQVKAAAANVAHAHAQSAAAAAAAPPASGKSDTTGSRGWMGALSRLGSALTEPVVMRNGDDKDGAGARDQPPSPSSALSALTAAAGHKQAVAKPIAGSSSHADGYIKLEEWLSSPDMDFYPGHLVKKLKGGSQGALTPRIVVVTKGYILSLLLVDHAPTAPAPAEGAATEASPSGDKADAAPAKPTLTQYLNLQWQLSGRAAIRSKYQLRDLDRVTCSKQMPHLVTFHWKAASALHSGNASPSSSNALGQSAVVTTDARPPVTFLLRDSAACIAKVTDCFRALKMAESEAATQAAQQQQQQQQQGASVLDSVEASAVIDDDCDDLP